MTAPLLDIRGRVLVMDYDRARAARRCGQLTSAGWSALHAGDEAEALTHVRGGNVDVVALHVTADEAEAMDLPNVVRLAAEVPHLPVVILAPEPAEETRCQYLDSGADIILADDISPAELGAHLRAMMRAKVLQDELHASREALSASLDRERALLDQLRRDNAHLLTLCTTDPLTHLQNVRYFDAILEKQFKIARRYERGLTVLVFDLDHFKVVNDTHGHPSGDYVLKEFAVILKRCVRDSDVVARTGGEEFSIILPNASRGQGRRFAQRIRRSVFERKFTVYGEDIHVTTSIGLASYPDDSEITAPAMLVYFADQALMLAKRHGRDRVVSFHDLDAAVRRDLRGQFLAARPGRRIKGQERETACDARR